LRHEPRCGRLGGKDCLPSGNLTMPVEGFFSKFARSVLRHIRVTSKQELKDRIMAGIEDVNRHPVIHTWSYKLAEAA
jgi:hypothetical protein